MASFKRQNISVPISYVDSTGQEKTRWQNIGKAFHSEKGISIKLDCIPTGNWDGYALLFDEQDRQQAPQGQGYGGPQPGYAPQVPPQHGYGNPNNGYPPPQAGRIQPNSQFNTGTPFPPAVPPDDSPF